LNSKPLASSAVIIFNPFAGRGKAPNIARKARTHLEQSGWEVKSVIATAYAGHTEKVLASEWGKKVQLIVLVGGDGTLRELVAGLWAVKLETEIGFIPMGNANVVARELNIPLKPERAIKLLTTGESKKIDICVLKQKDEQGLIFLAMLEIGFGAKVVQFADQLRNGALKALYQLWGDLVYAIAGALALKGMKSEYFTAAVEQTDETALPSATISSSHCVIANMQTYAKGWSLTPDAKCDDGLIDIAISKKSNAWSIISTFLAASKKRKLKPSLMSYQQTKHVSISSHSSLFVQVDGDPISFSGEADICIEREAFSIRVNAS